MLGDNRDNSADSRYFGFAPPALSFRSIQLIAIRLDEIVF
jgi:hypothetical protein